MIFLDTSAIYAWADTADPNHATAIRLLRMIVGNGEELLTHNYVLLESVVLLQARLSVSAAVKLAKDASMFVIEWVDEDLHAAGMRELEQSRKRRISLVDHISFLVMRRHKVSTAFSFDRDFISAGFQRLELGD